MQQGILEQLGTLFNTYPVAMVVIPILVLIILCLNWFWREVLSDWIADNTKKKIDRKLQEREQAQKQLETLYDINRRQLHRSMEAIIRDCLRKGYRTSKDTSEFGHLFADYKIIQGNHDGHIIEHDFMGIKPQPTMEMPIPIGYEYTLRKSEYDKVYNAKMKEVEDDNNTNYRIDTRND